VILVCLPKGQCLTQQIASLKQQTGPAEEDVAALQSPHRLENARHQERSAARLKNEQRRRGSGRQQLP
jgi:hypothetical protein